MKPEKDKIKDIFGSKLQNFEPQLPPLMWEKIDAGLSAQQKLVKAPTKRINIYKYSATVASIAALIVIALLVFLPQDDIQPESLAINESPKTNKAEHPKTEVAESTDKIEKTEKDNRSFTQSTHEFIASLNNQTYKSSQKEKKQNQNSELTTNTQEKLPIASDNILEETANNIPIVTSNGQEYKTFVAENNESSDNLSDQQSEEQFEKELGEKITDLEAYARKGEQLLADNNIPQDKKRNSDEESPSKGFQMGAGGGGSFSSKARAEEMQLRRINYALSDAGEYSNSPNINSSMSDKDIKLYQRQKMKLKHNQPISFGVTVSKSINKRIAIESGITYSYISSKFESTGDSDLDAFDSQSFHYVGIPLAINYKILEWNKLQVYLTGGGLIQKDFYGRMKISQNAPALLNTQDSEKKIISQKHPQFSANASLGISYPLYNRLSAYTNVGGAYYFDAKNEYETIYSDRKYQLNLNFGLKFQF